MNPFNVGDIVSVLYQDISGKVIDSGKVFTTIEDQDGLRLKIKTNELVLKPALSDYGLSDVFVKAEDLVEFKQSPIVKSNKTNSNKISNVPEIDLHLEALEDKIYLESHNQILQKQLTAFKNFYKKAVEKKHKRIVVIHGKGEGILKAEIHLFLNRIQKDGAIQLSYNEADLNEYGAGGATEIIFKW